MARRKRRPLEELKNEESNMTPMIDIVFQLLIFFMLSMHFKEVEGKLLSQLPKDKGLAPSHVLQPELQEVRIVICAGGDWNTHIFNKGKHEKEDKPNEVCKILVEKHEMGDVFMTEKHKDKAAHNRNIYKLTGQRVKELYDATPSTKDPSKRAPVILDADSEVGYEHVIGAVNTVKEQGIDNIEFVGNPRLEKYYGSGQKTGEYDNRKKR